MVSSNFVRAFWYMSNNFGDNINYCIIKSLSKKEPIYTDNRFNEEHFIVCGSIITESNDFTTVWGAGAAYYSDIINKKSKIISTRGKLTRDLVKNKKKEIHIGDPSLIMPTIYFPQKQDKLYKYGIIPHWKDMEKILSMKLPDIKIISPLQDVNNVIDDIVSCENVLSSSLHGLIIADSYGIPNKWLDIGTNIGGDGFKFHDYYSTTDTPKEDRLREFSFEYCSVKKTIINIDEYINTCPFKNNNQ